MGYETTAFTFYKGVANLEELMAYMENHKGNMPDSEMFAELSPGDQELIAGKGYIAEEPTDQEIIDEIPRTLRMALGLDKPSLSVTGEEA